MGSAGRAAPEHNACASPTNWASRASPIELLEAVPSLAGSAQQEQAQRCSRVRTGQGGSEARAGTGDMDIVYWVSGHTQKNNT